MAHAGTCAPGCDPHRPDVVHIHNTFPLLSPSVLYACRDEGVPVVITLHNYRLLCAGGSFFRDGAICRDCVSGPAIQAVKHGCYKNSRLATAPVALSNAVHRQAWRTLVSAYIFISAAQRDLLAELDLPPERVFVRHNLIPRRTMPQWRAASTRALRGTTRRGQGHPGPDGRRGTTYLPGAGDDALDLVIAGTGLLHAEVATWAESRPSVRLAGHVSDEQAAALMSRSRAVILPSIWAEPFGLVAVEAMAAGTACIASDHAALPELITHGVDGTLVPPADPRALADAIADVQARPDTYASYGQAARETYQKKFDPEQNIDQLLGIYRYAMAHAVSVARTPEVPQ